MKLAPTVPDEAERLAELRALNILDTPGEERFDRITRLASSVLATPIAYVALIDAERQWFKSKIGLQQCQTDRDISFCGHTILQHEPLIVPDTQADERFRDNPLVIGEPGLRFYAGVPLTGPNGRNVGTLCVADTKPRDLSASQAAVLREFGHLVERELGLVDLIHAQRQLLDTKNALVRSQHRLAEELAEAADYVRSLLPERLNGELVTDWRFFSCSQLGGDAFGYHWLDDDRLAIYLLDVTGHGTGAALLSISVINMLRSQALASDCRGCPRTILEELNRAFPMDEHGGKFFTIWCGVYHRSDRRLHWAGAGHPASVLVSGHGHDSTPLRSQGMVIGVKEDAEYKNDVIELAPDQRLYVFSDGVFEVPDPDGRMLGYDEFVKLLCEPPANGTPRLDHAVEHVRRWQNAEHFADDFSLLEIEFR